MPAWLEAPCKRTQIFLFEGSQLFALLTAEGTGEGLDSVTPPSTPFLAKTVLSEPLEPSERRRNQSDEESTFVGGAAEMHAALDAETLSFVPKRTGTNSCIRCKRVIGKRFLEPVSRFDSSDQSENRSATRTRWTNQEL